MVSRKLNTEHLANQIETILDEDGVSPEKLANLSRIAKTTIYSILNRDRPTTQRGVARKIAEATGRTFYIEDDKIVYHKPHPVSSEQTSSAHNQIMKSLDTSLKNYSEEEKELLLECQIENNFKNMVDLLLSMQASTQQKSHGVRSQIEKEQSIERKFHRIWDQLGTSKTEKIDATRTLLKNVNLPKLIYTSFKLEINIFNPQGDAQIIRKIHATNVGNENVMGELKTMWFEETQLQDVKLSGSVNGERPLKIDIRRDYQNYKEIFCDFQQPVEPGQSIKYSYEASPRKMFRQHHYWDWIVGNLVLNSRIIIRHKKSKKFKSCTISKETSQGLIRVENPNLRINADAEEVRIIWMKYFPEYGTKYRIHWEFEDD